MTMSNPSYIEIISRNYPNISVMSYSDGQDYGSLVLLAGDAIPDKATLDLQGVDLIKADVWRAIQSRRDSRKQGGVKIGDYWYHSDDTSRIQQIGLVMFGQNMPAGIQWKTMSGAFVTMTPALASQIFTSVASSDVTIFGIAEYHRQTMLASSDPANYNYTAGWPAIYGE